MAFITDKAVWEGNSSYKRQMDFSPPLLTFSLDLGIYTPPRESFSLQSLPFPGSLPPTHLREDSGKQVPHLQNLC